MYKSADFRGQFDSPARMHENTQIHTGANGLSTLKLQTGMISF